MKKENKSFCYLTNRDSLHFTILSMDEEKLLNIEQKKEYYKQLKQYMLKRKLTNTTKGATSIAPKLYGITCRIAISMVKLFSDKNCEWIVDGQENIPEGPVIFACTHQGILDNFVGIPLVKKHSIYLHGAEVNKLLIMSQLNTGLVLIIKGNIENNRNAKYDMIRLLSEGHSITYYPEGTWNLSPNKLHLPLRYGFLDIARKANVPVVPVVHEFTYDTTSEKEKITKIHSYYDKPIFIAVEDDIVEKLKEYQERISTIRYKLIEEKGLYKRRQITNIDYINYLKGNYKNLKLGKLNLKKEKENIFTAQDDFYLFHHINDIPYDSDGNLLDTDENMRLKKLCTEHGIYWS